MIALYIIGGLIVIILIVAAIIGTAWTYERSIVIQSPPDKVWNHVNTLAAFNEWNPWVARDAQILLKYSGVDGTPGASFTWDSELKSVGAGSQTIINVVPQSLLASRLTFFRPFQGAGDAYIKIKEEGGSTTATWGIVSATPYPFNIIKIFGVIEKNMNKDFEQGLNKLKELCEN